MDQDHVTSTLMTALWKCLQALKLFAVSWLVTLVTLSALIAPLSGVNTLSPSLEVGLTASAIQDLHKTRPGLTSGHCYDDSVQPALESSEPLNLLEDASEEAFLTPPAKCRGQGPSDRFDQRDDSALGYQSDIDHRPPKPTFA